MNEPAEPETLSYGASYPGSRIRGFWARQFQAEATPFQIAFDVFWGMLLPVVCLVMDPIVFQGRDAAAPHLKMPGYIAFGSEITVLGAWLLVGQRHSRRNRFFTAPLISGAIIAGLIGLAMLPLSIIGLFVIIGALGFTPFFTAFVFGRNAARSRLCSSPTTRGRHHALIGLLLTLLFFSGLIGGTVRVRQTTTLAIQEITSDSVPQQTEGVEKLKRLGWFADTQAIVEAFVRIQSSNGKANLARAYRQLTGKDIELEADRFID